MADEAKTASAAAAEAQPQPQAQQVEVKVDEAGMTSAYTNWYRVTGTPEELIIDFGLNPQMGQLPTMPIKVTDRLVMNFYTAKRLLNALHYAVSRHENFFGALEVDIQRRLRPQALAQQQRPAGSSGFAQ
jgi:uncharacterized protein DUF3467